MIIKINTEWVSIMPSIGDVLIYSNPWWNNAFKIEYKGKLIYGKVQEFRN